MALKAVKPLHCQKLLNAMQGYSKKYMKKVKIFLHGLFESAIDNGLLLDNPAQKINVPDGPQGSHRAITQGERAHLLNVCDTHPAGLWVKIMLYCGLRPGETARIMGRHIDLKKRLLYVDGTKTASAKRHVPIPEALLGDLARAKTAPFQYLFTNREGRQISQTNMRRMWDQIRKAMHIAMGGRTDYGDLCRVIPPYIVAPDLVPYCLRHTYCTDLQAAGVPINVAKEFMGHSSISVTANIYTHMSDDSFENGRSAIDQFHSEHTVARCVDV